MTIRNAKSLADIDSALLALSEDAGGGGEFHRHAHGGRHRFDIGRSKTHPDDIESWGARIAEGAGCRIKLMGLSDDRTLVQGFLDADNWAIDEAGIAQPYGDGSFDALPGVEHRPSWMEPSPAPTPASSLASPAWPSSGDEAEAETPVLAGVLHGEAKEDEVAHAEPARRPRPGSPSPALALARALVACGVDPDELMLALARVGRTQGD